MTKKTSKTKVFLTVGIDLFAVIALIFFLKQQIEKNVAPSMVHKITEVADGFHPIFYNNQQQIYQYVDNIGWVETNGDINDTTHFFIRCSDQSHCYDLLGVDMSKKNLDLTNGSLLWALPIERQEIAQTTFTNLCTTQSKCNLTFVHSRSGTKLEEK